MMEQKEVTVIWREGNPLLKGLPPALRNRGFSVDTRELPGTDTYSTYEPWGKPDGFRAAIGEVKGVVVTDITTHDLASQVGLNPINAYSALNIRMDSIANVANLVRPIQEELKADGRTLIVLTQFLGDHLDDVINLPREEAIKTSAYSLKFDPEPAPEDYMEEYLSHPPALHTQYAAILNHELGVPVFERHVFEYPQNYIGRISESYRTIPKALESLGLTTEQGVLGVDHHIGSIPEDIAKKAGLFEVNIIPICPCCIDLKSNLQRSLIRHGFSLYPLKYEGRVSQLADNLTPVINARLAGITENPSE
jgi:hypothetical protein